MVMAMGSVTNGGGGDVPVSPDAVKIRYRGYKRQLHGRRVFVL